MYGTFTDNIIIKSKHINHFFILDINLFLLLPCLLHSSNFKSESPILIAINDHLILPSLFLLPPTLIIILFNLRSDILIHPSLINQLILNLFFLLLTLVIFDLLKDLFSLLLILRESSTVSLVEAESEFQIFGVRDTVIQRLQGSLPFFTLLHYILVEAII